MPDDTSRDNTGSIGSTPSFEPVKLDVTTGDNEGFALETSTLTYFDEVMVMTKMEWEKALEMQEYLNSLPSVEFTIDWDADRRARKAISDAIIDGAIDSVYGPRKVSTLEFTPETEL
jgi:hypothetical protein